MKDEQKLQLKATETMKLFGITKNYETKQSMVKK